VLPVWTDKLSAEPNLDAGNGREIQHRDDASKRNVDDIALEAWERGSTPPSRRRRPCLTRSVPTAATRGPIVLTSTTASRFWAGSTPRPPHDHIEHCRSRY
jgi:hypothetical protein